MRILENASNELFKRKAVAQQSIRTTSKTCIGGTKYCQQNENTAVLNRFCTVTCKNKKYAKPNKITKLLGHSSGAPCSRNKKKNTHKQQQGAVV